MFDIERWQEIFDTIRKNKLRTFLTGFSVASGIFILVILLGFGQGMQNGIAEEFSKDAATSIWVSPGVTRKEFKGLNSGRRIKLTTQNYKFASKLLEDDIDNQSPRLYVNNVSINYGKETLSYGIRGISYQFQFIENQFITKGRFINYNDEKNATKVILISTKIEREIFKDIDNPVGKFLSLSGVKFKIVGVYKDLAGDQEEDRVFIPITTAQKVFYGSDEIHNIAYSLPPAENFDIAAKESAAFQKNLLGYLQKEHTIAPDDTSAIRVFSVMEEAERYYSLIGNIKLFFWFVGICTIIAGVVGVSNIMLIVVKERTREIGIRKALGAKPKSVVGMILHESIFVTSIAGFSGLIFSMTLLEFLGPYVDVPYVSNPTVNFAIAITTVFVLILAGAIAGFFPAWRAASIHTIDALRDE